MNVCECCESGLPAIKVEGLFVCKKCNNFNCGICGLENNSHGYLINWSETKGICVCDNCNDVKCECEICDKKINACDKRIMNEFLYNEEDGFKHIKHIVCVKCYDNAPN
jgi:hypothetical protein